MSILQRLSPLGFGRLELLLVLAFLALLFQVFPALWLGLLWALDVRNWPREVWLAINVGVVLALFAIRFGPELAAGRRSSPSKRPKGPESGSDPHETDWRKLSAKEQEALFRRMEAARRKQSI